MSIFNTDNFSRQSETNQTKVVQSKGWFSVGCYLTYYPWVLEYRIPIQATYSLDSLDDNLKNHIRILPLRGKVRLVSLKQNTVVRSTPTEASFTQVELHFWVGAILFMFNSKSNRTVKYIILHVFFALTVKVKYRNGTFTNHLA